MSDLHTPQPDAANLRVERVEGRLSILEDGHQTPICVDFLSSKSAQRRAGIRRSSHPLARAVGRKTPLADILDGTAGLGRDAFILASLGYRVLATERSPVLHALLQDGLTRMLADPRSIAIVGDRLQVQLADCRELLKQQPAPAVVYLDPMFPERPKSAKVKREMQLFHQLLGPDTDAVELLAMARSTATDRVVVKRPVWAKPLANAPSYTVDGSTIRWDVYLASPDV